MKKIEKEIQDFHIIQAEIANMESALLKCGELIVSKYCPFKKGDRVKYKEWWRDENDPVDLFGIITDISFRGINENAIDGKWLIAVQPTKKDFSENKRRIYTKWIGKNKGDVIFKVN